MGTTSSLWAKARSSSLVVVSALIAVAVFVLVPIRGSSANVEPITVGGITVAVGPVQGKEMVSVAGKAPAMAPVTLTIFATISKDLPDVFINRRDILTDSSGHYSAMVPIAPDFWRGTILTVTASSPDVTSTATARTLVIIPNPNVPGVALPADDLPNH
jgi:hypothetical protein